MRMPGVGTLSSQRISVESGKGRTQDAPRLERPKGHRGSRSIRREISLDRGTCKPKTARDAHSFEPRPRMRRSTRGLPDDVARPRSSTAWSLSAYAGVPREEA